jgi:ribulose-phosphate 3-epimerase
MLTVHVEACPHLQRTLVQIREQSARRGVPVKAGAALNPATSPRALEYVLEDLDLVLVMSVNPGFGGQQFIPAVYPKIRQIRTLLGARPVHVSIDGGVKVEHARPLAAHGASILVAGSAVFHAADPAAVIREMRAAAG